MKWKKRTTILIFLLAAALVAAPVSASLVANMDWFIIERGKGPVTLDLLVNDYDDTNPYSSFWISECHFEETDAGTFVKNADDSITFTPDIGDDSDNAWGEYNITNSDGDDASNKFVINIARVQITANDDAAATSENTPVTVDVLANDNENTGFRVWVFQPAYGTASGGDPDSPIDGNVTYTPPPDWTGVDTFTYTATNGAQADSATVTITVEEAENHALNRSRIRNTERLGW